MSVNPRDKIRRTQQRGPLDLNNFMMTPRVEEGAAAGFCQAIQLEVAGTCSDRAWKEPGKTWMDYPWITLVLGSGPVGLPDPFWAAAPRLPALVNATIERCMYKNELLVNSFRDDPRLIVTRFLESVIEDRVGHLQDRESDHDAVKIGEFAAALVLLAAQLTQVFHMLSLGSGRPVSRWGSVVARVVLDGKQEDEDLAEQVRPIRVVTNFALGRLGTESLKWTPGQGFTEAVKHLLNEIDDNLAHSDHYQVNLDHLREVTDIAWQCLVWEVCEGSYPGWTELMLNLVLLQESAETSVERRPRWRQLVELAEQIDGIIRPAAGRSWQQSRPSSATRQAGARGFDATRDFYDAAATLLWKQAVAARSQRRGGEAAAHEDDHVKRHMTAAGLPKAVAFVTSFDLELEMALLRTLPRGERFVSVVVPVYLVNDVEDVEGEFLWLEGVVDLAQRVNDGDEALACLTDPVQWRVMYQGRYELPEHPIIVRLTGSPLMKLPSPTLVLPPPSSVDDHEDSLASDLRLVGVAPNTNNQFLHSATVDEYLALRQAEAEYFWVYSRNTFANISTRALPKALLACREPGPIRFWMTVGVPMKDPAVRLRVLSQMGGRRFMLGRRGEMPGRTRRLSMRFGRTGNREIPGLAVNWRLDDEESMLLSSLGLRVIKQGRAEDFASDLEHYAWHLAATAEGLQPRAGSGRCPKDPAAGRSGR